MRFILCDFLRVFSALLWMGWRCFQIERQYTLGCHYDRINAGSCGTWARYETLEAPRGAFDPDDGHDGGPFTDVFTLLQCVWTSRGGPGWCQPMARPGMTWKCSVEEGRMFHTGRLRWPNIDLNLHFLQHTHSM